MSDEAVRTHTCSCGEIEPHIVARRVTADGKHVCLWDDGTLTWSLGYHIRGGMRPRTEAQHQTALRVGWLVLGEVCLHDAAEVPELIAAARWAVKRDGLPGTVRRRLRARREATSLPTWLRPSWQIYQANRDGRPVVRTWRLHRLSPWAGYVVWHERGRYELLRLITPTHNHQDESATATGVKFATLGALIRWLAANSRKNK